MPVAAAEAAARTSVVLIYRAEMSMKTGQNFFAWSASFPGALLFFVPELFP